MMNLPLIQYPKKSNMKAAKPDLNDKTMNTFINRFICSLAINLHTRNHHLGAQILK